MDRIGPDAAAWRCHFKKVCLRIEPNGDVLDCTRDAVALSNARRCPLRQFTRSDEFTEFLARAERCNRCRDYAVVEISHLWEGKVEALQEMLAVVDVSPVQTTRHWPGLVPVSGVISSTSSLKSARVICSSVRSVPNSADVPSANAAPIHL